MPSGLRSQVWQIAIWKGGGEDPGEKKNKKSLNWEKEKVNEGGYSNNRQGLKHSNFSDCLSIKLEPFASKAARFFLHAEARVAMNFGSEDLYSHIPGPKEHAPLIPTGLNQLPMVQ